MGVVNVSLEGISSKSLAQRRRRPGGLDLHALRTSTCIAASARMPNGAAKLHPLANCSATLYQPCVQVGFAIDDQDQDLATGHQLKLFNWNGPPRRPLDDHQTQTNLS